MAMEAACAECGGRLLIETPGEVVECPHCGAHLSLPDAAESTSAASTAFPTDDPAIASNTAPEPPLPWTATAPSEAQSSATEFEADIVAGWPPPAEENDALFPDLEGAAEARSEGELQAATASAVLRAGDLAAPAVEWPQIEDRGSAGDVAAVTAATVIEHSAAALQIDSEPRHVSAPSGRGSATTDPAASRNVGPGVSKNVFVLVLSYASVMTLLFLYLLLTSLRADPHQLESLPDVEPPMKDEEILPVFVPQDAPMPKGHTLRLGETQRFGSLEVTPLRVTRGPLQFAHFSDASKTQPDGPPVLKLWLRFRNVSKDQAVKPLGKPLVFNRFPDPDDPAAERANNFVARAADQHSGGPVVLLHDLVVEDVWDLKGQDVERRLKPGESFETYVPTRETGLDGLQGDLVWRVHFRKGHNPDSGRGVTTLIEVPFRSDDVRAS